MHGTIEGLAHPLGYLIFGCKIQDLPSPVSELGKRLESPVDPLPIGGEKWIVKQQKSGCPA